MKRIPPQVFLVGFGRPKNALSKCDLPDNVVLIDSSAALSMDWPSKEACTVFVHDAVGGQKMGEIRRRLNGNMYIPVGSLTLLRLELTRLVGPEKAEIAVGCLTPDPKYDFRMSDETFNLVPNHTPIAFATAGVERKQFYSPGYHVWGWNRRKK